MWCILCVYCRVICQPKSTGEQKTKPTQNTVRELRGLGLSPDLAGVVVIVCPSVTRWYCIKTAEYIVMLSSPHDSPFILVLCISRSSRNFDGATEVGCENVVIFDQ